MYMSVIGKYRQSFDCYKSALSKPENTHLLRKGKYPCTADLLFDRLGFGQISKSVYSFNSTKQLNPKYSDISPYEVSECSLPKPSLFLPSLGHVEVTSKFRYCYLYCDEMTIFQKNCGILCGANSTKKLLNLLPNSPIILPSHFCRMVLIEWTRYCLLLSTKQSQKPAKSYRTSERFL